MSQVGARFKLKPHCCLAPASLTPLQALLSALFCLRIPASRDQALLLKESDVKQKLIAVSPLTFENALWQQSYVGTVLANRVIATEYFAYP